MNFDEIFTIDSEESFNQKALEVFHFQYQNTCVYKQFVDFLKVERAAIKHYTEIPFLPIEFFKTQKIHHKDYAPTTYFESSGTTSTTNSKHFVVDEKIYQKSILEEFKNQIGNPSDYVILGLLPSYLERKNASLISMVDFLMKESNQAENGYFLYDHQALFNLLETLSIENKQVILLGVSFAMLDFSEAFSIPFENITIIETGGMKGRKVEITKQEVLQILQNSFPKTKIYSEYGMTELFSQAYSNGGNRYKCPNWMKVLTRELDDPLSFTPKNQTGAINIIDLANVYTCSFIATQDMGKVFEENTFEILGRMDNSDIRGCSLMVS